MKYIIYPLLCCITLVGTAQTNTTELSSYEKLLKRNVELLDQAEDQAEFENVLNRFERLKSNAPQEWLPLYYTGYCKVILAKWTKDEKSVNDAISDLKEAIKLNNSGETHALLARAYILLIQLNFDNASIYTGMVKNMLNEGLKLDTSNPRLYLIYGRFYYYFPAFVGGDKNKAKKLFEKAEGLFEIEYVANQENPTTLPHWGKELNTAQITNF